MTHQPLHRLPRPGSTLRKIQAVEQHGVVAREEAAVVFQHGQVQTTDLGVRRVELHAVDLAAADRLIREVVLDAAHLPHPQAVVRGQARPAVLPRQELVREREAELGVRLEVRDAPDPQPLRRLPAHRQRVAVVEAEGVADADALWAQGGAHRFETRPARGLKDRLGDRAGVFRVEVHLALLQRLEHDVRAPQVGSVLYGRLSRPGPQHPQRLAQDPRLRERLGADPDLTGIGVPPVRQEQQPGGGRQDPPAQRHERAPSSQGRRCAEMNSPT